MCLKRNKKHLACFLIALICIVLNSCTIKNEIMYPLEYKDTIITYCDAYSVPYELVCAVIRTESNFNVDAKSSVGAVGLMQLLPVTAEEIAWRLGEEYTEEKLTEPETNIKYGCFYLSYLYRNLGENWDTACAAYNAGIGRVKGWLEDKAYSDDGVTLKAIPFDETRSYVEKISQYKVKYKELYFTDEGEEICN